MPKKENTFLEFVLDQLQSLPDVRSSRMFGGHGMYQGDIFFAIVADGRLYFRTGEETRPEYERRGMKPFQPTKEQVLKNYHEGPVDVLEDDGELCEWAKRAVRAQQESKLAPRKSKKRREPE